MKPAHAMHKISHCSLNSATTHPYLTKKGIGPHGVLISGEDLIIPMSDQNKVWSYQTIKPDGEKLFYGGPGRG
jgi:phage/plasmid primase-like uncharacterized protein